MDELIVQTICSDFSKLIFGEFQAKYTSIIYLCGCLFSTTMLINEIRGTRENCFPNGNSCYVMKRRRKQYPHFFSNSAHCRWRKSIFILALFSLDDFEIDFWLEMNEKLYFWQGTRGKYSPSRVGAYTEVEMKFNKRRYIAEQIVFSEKKFVQRFPLCFYSRHRDNA